MYSTAICSYSLRASALPSAVAYRPSAKSILSMAIMFFAEGDSVFTSHFEVQSNASLATGTASLGRF